MPKYWIEYTSGEIEIFSADSKEFAQHYSMGQVAGLLIAAG